MISVLAIYIPGLDWMDIYGHNYRFIALWILMD